MIFLVPAKQWYSAAVKAWQQPANYLDFNNIRPFKGSHCQKWNYDKDHQVADDDDNNHCDADDDATSTADKTGGH